MPVLEGGAMMVLDTAYRLVEAFRKYAHVFGRASPPLEEGWPKAGVVMHAETFIRT